MTAAKEQASWKELALDQDGTLGRAQALAGGLHPSGWDWRIGRGLWGSLCGGVVVTHSGVPTERQLFWGAALRAGTGAAISGDAALIAWGVKRLTLTRIDVGVPRIRSIDDFVVHTTPVAVHRLTRLATWTKSPGGLPLTEMHVAALHAAAWADTDEAAERRIAMTVQQRKCAVKVFRETIQQMPRLNRRALILEVLDDVELGAHANSELDFLRFCRRNGLPEPDELQVRVRAGGLKYVDARYVKQKVSVEVDGGYHMEEAQWNADSLRSLELVVAQKGTNEVQIRVTRSNIRHHEQRVAGLLRQLLCS